MVKTKKLTFTLMILTLLVLTVPQTHVRADDGVDISQFPQALSDALGIPLIAGQLLASTLTLCIFLFPTMLLTSKRKNQDIAVLIVAIPSLSLCIALQWLPLLIFLVILLLISATFAYKVKGLYT